MSLRNRIFGVFVLAALLAGGGLVWWMSAELRPRYMEAQEDLMVDMGQVLAAQIEAGALRPAADTVRIDQRALRAALSDLEQRPVDAQVYRLRKRRVDLRIYVTNAQGEVVFDSDGGRDLGRNNSGWRDIRLSLSGEYGARTTEGDPIFPDGATMYVSTPIRHQGEIVGVVSIGKPTRNAERFRAAALQRFGQAAVLALGLALLVALGLYWWLSRPLQQLHDYAGALRRGERAPPPRLGDNEIGRVGRAMSEMKAALDGKQYVEHYVQALTHELKSPTAAIRGAAELLAEDMPLQEQGRFLANIRGEAGRLQDLLERMLELAGIENRQALGAPETVPLAPLLDEAQNALAAPIRARGLTIEIDSSSALTVQGERFLLLRAGINLLDNAVAFSPVGGVVQIGAHAADDMVCLQIRDQGPGIPDYARERVFERFFSLPREDGRKGTGLGLSFVREIAALHGGSISLEAAAGSGTLVVLCLPAAAE